jgi:hypothetical protein
MPTTTPGTRLEPTSALSFPAVRTVLLVVAAGTLVLLGMAIRSATVEAGYLDAFERGGVTAVVQHAADRGDSVERFPDGVRAPGGCYLADGEVVEHLSADECRAAAEHVADVTGS